MRFDSRETADAFHTWWLYMGGAHFFRTVCKAAGCSYFDTCGSVPLGAIEVEAYDTPADPRCASAANSVAERVTDALRSP